MRSIKKFMSVVILLGIVTICLHNSYAHSGRTDSNGGHRDNKNVSGLGSYHYHHGYSPHLHPNGVCPYEEKQETAAPAKEEKPKSQLVAVESVRIDSQNNITLDINETLTLNAVVNPGEAANKHVTWTSSDTSVATVDSMGVITAKSAGDTVITATADNGKKDSITLTVNEVEIEDEVFLAFSEQEMDTDIATSTSTSTSTSIDIEQPDNIVSQNSKDSKDNLTENKEEESDGLTTGLGLTGAAIAFILYNTFKKKKK